jgi:hypothetical protein
MSAIDIFLHNFRNDILFILTGGTFALFSNFVTFAAISGLYVARHASLLVAVLVTAIAFGTYGTFEMLGHLCFGLIGFTFLERILLKKKTRLRRIPLFLSGSALIFLGALLESSLAVAFRKPP